MALKILLSGRNQRIVTTISEHLEKDRGYDVVRCPADEDSLRTKLAVERPEIMIICLNDENRNSVRAFNEAIQCPGLDEPSTIVVADDEELRTFRTYSSLHLIYPMSRPVSIPALYALLHRIEYELDMGMENAIQDIRDQRYRIPQGDTGFTRKRILVVDDDAQQLAQIKEHLSEFYDVTAVRSGEAALRYLDAHETDIMLLDYVMPNMDGAEVLYRIRTTRALFGLPVIFLTGMTEREKVVKTLVELKPQGYIVKPARKSEIVAKIIEVLG